MGATSPEPELEMIQRHLEAIPQRFVLGILAGASLGAILTVLSILAGATRFAPGLTEGPSVSLFTAPSLFISIGLFYWLPGLLLLGAPWSGVIRRHGYGRWFHVAALGAVLAAIYTYVALNAGWFVGLLLLAPPCWWFAYRDGHPEGLTGFGGFLAGIIFLAWLPLLVIIVFEPGAFGNQGLSPVVIYGAAAMSLVGAVVSQVTWSIAYRGWPHAGSDMRPA